MIELPETMFWRVAEAVSSVEKKQKRNKYKKEFFDMMSSLEFIPNSPTLFNAGTRHGCGAACFVLPIEDKMESIFGTLKHAAKIHQEGGGTGFSFTNIRPNGAVISTGGSASGPVSFMYLYDTMTDVVKQGGVRRGANMGVLSVNHPDIVEFINCKKEHGRFQNFNISVMLDGEFLRKAKKGQRIELVHRGSGVIKEANAGDILDTLIENTLASGDPGILFGDNINRHNLTPQFGKIVASNPCSEALLHSYQSCVLGSLNIPAFVNTEKQDFNWEKLGNCVTLAIRFLDNVIESTSYPLPRIKDKTLQSRKIGLGIMGWADALITFGIPYDDPNALIIAERLMKFIHDRAYATSRDLGKEKGCVLDFNRRNVNLLSIAPTGSLSIIAGGVSTGIEPHFHTKYTRTIANGYDVDYNVGDDVKTAYDINPKDHIKMAAVFQKHVDQGISKTVNIPFNTTHDEVKELIYFAHEQGLKSISFYREGSHDVSPVQPSCSLDRCFV